MDPSFQSAFWDINLRTFDPQQYPRFTIERIIEHGNLQMLSWLENNFTKQEIYDYTQTSRNLSPKSQAFIKARYGT